MTRRLNWWLDVDFRSRPNDINFIREMQCTNLMVGWATRNEISQESFSDVSIKLYRHTCDYYSTQSLTP